MNDLPDFRGPWKAVESGENNNGPVYEIVDCENALVADYLPARLATLVTEAPAMYDALEQFCNAFDGEKGWEEAMKHGVDATLTEAQLILKAIQFQENL